MWWCPKSSVWELEGAHPCRCTICVTVFLLHGSSSFCDIRSNETPEALLCLCQRATPQFTTMAIVCNCSFAKHVTGNIEPKRRSKIGCSSPVSQTSHCHSRISTPTPFHCSVITPTSHYQVTTNPSNPSIFDLHLAGRRHGDQEPHQKAETVPATLGGSESAEVHVVGA